MEPTLYVHLIYLHVHLILRSISEGFMDTLKLFKRIQNKNVAKNEKIYILVCIKMKTLICQTVCEPN